MKITPKTNKTIQGWFKKDGKLIFMRSSWELNFAHYLNFLQKHKEIIKWEYEPETFWFEGIRRGVCSYKPDFKIYEKDGHITYYEVKGYLDPRSKTKLTRMKKYFPSIKVRLFDAKQYASLAKHSELITGWGTWVTKEEKDPKKENKILAKKALDLAEQLKKRVLQNAKKQ